MDFLIFFVAAAAIAAAGPRLVDAVEAVEANTGIGRVWLGTVLLAGATSLPELVSATSAAVIGEPDLALGTVLGSNMFNMTILAVALIWLPRKIPAGGSGLAASAVAIAMALLAVLFLLVAEPRLGGVGVGPIVLVIVYAGGSYLLYQIARRSRPEAGEEDAPPDSDQARAPDDAESSRDTASSGGAESSRGAMSLRGALGLLAASSAVVFAAAVFLPSAAEGIAETLGVSGGVMGVVGIALATSLPEIVTSVSALRRGAGALVVGNVFGSNIFNLAVLFPAELAFDPGGLFRAAGNEQAVPAAVGVALMALAVLSLRQRTGPRVLRAIGVLMVVGYLAGVGVTVALGIDGA